MLKKIASLILRFVCCWMVASILNAGIGYLHHLNLNDQNVREGLNSQKTFSIFESLRISLILIFFICAIYFSLLGIPGFKNIRPQKIGLIIFIISFGIVLSFMMASGGFFNIEIRDYLWVIIFCIPCSLIPYFDTLLFKKGRKN